MPESAQLSVNYCRLGPFRHSMTLRWTILLASLAVGLTAGASEQRRADVRLKEGDKAPNFKLNILHSEKTFELKSNFGERPTILIFGSYT